MAEILHEAHLGGNQNELQNWSLQKLTSDPVSPFAGQFWLNTTDDKLKYYDGVNTVVVASLSDVEGLLDFKGGYDAATNSPDLDVSPTGVLKGDVYVVTAAGTFFTEEVSIGDTLFAKVDGASALGDWVIVERNLNSATETTEGIARIATQAETDAGTNDTAFITPLKLANATSLSGVVKTFAIDLNSALTEVTRTVAGGVTTFVVTHTLNTLDVQVEIRKKADGKQTLFEVENTSTSTVTIRGNGTIADNAFRTVLQG
jgi:hypothetical protein